MELSLKEKYLLAIGQIVVNWNQLEEQMKLEIHFLIDHDVALTERITAGEPFENLLRMLAALFNYRITDRVQQDEFRRLVKALKRKNEDRNEYIHRVWRWSAFESTPPITSKSSKRNTDKFSSEIKLPRLEDLQVIAEGIEQLERRFNAFMSSNKDAIEQHKRDVVRAQAEGSLDKLIKRAMRKGRKQHETNKSKDKET